MYGRYYIRYPQRAQTPYKNIAAVQGNALCVSIGTMRDPAVKTVWYFHTSGPQLGLSERYKNMTQPSYFPPPLTSHFALHFPPSYIYSMHNIPPPPPPSSSPYSSVLFLHPFLMSY